MKRRDYADADVVVSVAAVGIDSPLGCKCINAGIASASNVKRQPISTNHADGTKKLSFRYVVVASEIAVAIGNFLIRPDGRVVL